MDMTVQDKILRRIKKAVPGWAFTPGDLLEFGTPQAVGMALTRLLREGAIRRLRRGIYDVPRQHARLGVLSPDPRAVATALARRDGARIQPGASQAANTLRLSDQVPARVVYETDGPSRRVEIGRQTIELRHQGPKRIRNAAPMSNLVFAALRQTGRDNVTRPRIAHLRRELKPADRERLLKDMSRAPVWMHAHIRFIAGAPELTRRRPNVIPARKRATRTKDE
jgi:hypothetical protein